MLTKQDRTPLIPSVACDVSRPVVCGRRNDRRDGGVERLFIVLHDPRRAARTEPNAPTERPAGSEPDGHSDRADAQTQTPPPVPTHAPIRAAFFYPWYPETWYADQAHTPSAGLYNSSDATTLRRQVREARYAHLDAFISSWWGIGQPTDRRLPMLLDAAKAQGFHIAPYYEPEGTTNPTIAAIKHDLAHFESLAATYGNTWLRVNGKPVIFVYNTNDKTCAISRKWHDAAPNWYVSLKVFSGYRTCPIQPDSWHQYVPSLPIDEQLPYSVRISPGFQLHGTAPRLSRDPARFEDSIRRHGGVEGHVATRHQLQRMGRRHHRRALSGLAVRLRGTAHTSMHSTTAFPDRTDFTQSSDVIRRPHRVFWRSIDWYLACPWPTPERNAPSRLAVGLSVASAR